MSRTQRIASSVALVTSLALAGATKAQELPNGEQLYVQRCAACHDRGMGGAPARTVISQRSHGAIVDTLSTGVMQPMASGLKPEEIAALATYLLLEKPALASPENIPAAATAPAPATPAPAAPPAA